MDKTFEKDLLLVLKEEDELLDVILEQQALLHKNVIEKDWDNLNKNIINLQNLSDCFVKLEDERMMLCDDLNKFNDEKFSNILGSVRSKLNKSKIENHVLNQYVSTTRKFLQGVFDKAIPKNGNVLYSKNGNLVKPDVGSLLINQVV